MKKQIFTVLVGGKAGEGVKKAGQTIAAFLRDMNRHVFQMDDYQSLIKGGHNFSVISSSVRPIFSHYMRSDIVIAFDKKSYDIHKHQSSLVFYNTDEVRDGEGYGIPLTQLMKESYPEPANVSVCAIVIVARVFGESRTDILKRVSTAYRKHQDWNCDFASRILAHMDQYDLPTRSLEKGERQLPILSGNQMIALGAYAAGLESYYGYPMTPASSLMHFLASFPPDSGVKVIHAENEIAAINMAIGGAFAGQRTGVGSSGGGFALMQEAFSMAGMVESPLFCVLSSRPGPATGASTYTAQEDLMMALHLGHGEFPRIVASPPTMESAYHLAANLMELTWKYQTPVILLTEKHLSESAMTVELPPSHGAWATTGQNTEEHYQRYHLTESGISPLQHPPTSATVKWNSHEHLENGNRTDQAESMMAMKEKRAAKGKTLMAEIQHLETVKRSGKRGFPVFCYGSTYLTVQEAVKHLNNEIQIIAPIYLEPFPTWALTEFKEKEILVVEYSLANQFTTLLQEKLGVNVRKTIHRYDGRPFDPIELAQLILKELS